MTVTRDGIARAALALLDRTGLDGLTMRLVAAELGVRAPTLYWHVKNKQELLDAMADLLVAEANLDLAPSRPDEDWADWLIALAARMRRTMLGHRDGARVLAGSYTTHPSVVDAVELTLRTLGAAGVPPRVAARSVPAVLHYTVGFTIEEQARAGAAYAGENPYATPGLGARVDPDRHPLTTSVLDVLFDQDSDETFAHGLRLIVVGIRDAAASG